MLELALSAAVFLSAAFASAHAVIYKREPRVAALWVIVIWLVPAAGPLLYLIFDSEGAGKHFIGALAEAKSREVEVFHSSRWTGAICR